MRCWFSCCGRLGRSRMQQFANSGELPRQRESLAHLIVPAMRGGIADQPHGFVDRAEPDLIRPELLGAHIVKNREIAAHRRRFADRVAEAFIGARGQQHAVLRVPCSHTRLTHRAVENNGLVEIQPLHEVPERVHRDRIAAPAAEMQPIPLVVQPQLHQDLQRQHRVLVQAEHAAPANAVRVPFGQRRKAIRIEPVMHNVQPRGFSTMRGGEADAPRHVGAHHHRVVYLSPWRLGDTVRPVCLDPVHPDDDAAAAKIGFGNQTRKGRPAEFEPQRVLLRPIGPGERGVQVGGIGDVEGLDIPADCGGQRRDQVMREVIKPAQQQDSEARRTKDVLQGRPVGG